MSRHRKKNEINRILSVYNKYMAHSRSKNKWSISNEGNRIIYNERKSNISKIIHDLDISLTSKNILDVGCAGGNIFNLLQDLGAKEENIYGIDVRGDRLKEAKELFPASNFIQMDARELNFDDATFDIVFTFTIFSSIIEKKIRMEVADEICRVLKPNGVIIYYDIRYNNPFNSNVIKMTLDDIKYLFPNMIVKLKPVTILPPLIRALGKTSIELYPLLAKLNFLKTHYIGHFTKG